MYIIVQSIASKIEIQSEILSNGFNSEEDRRKHISLIRLLEPDLQNKNVGNLLEHVLEVRLFRVHVSHHNSATLASAADVPCLDGEC